MAEIVNLRTVRKQKRRGEARKDAAAAAAKAGERKAERERRAAEAELADRRHAAHRRDADPAADPGSPGSKSHWDGVYATKAEETLSWFEPDVAGRLALVARHLPDRQAAILDIGSGLSRLIPALVGAGYRDVTALDISAEAVERARRRAGCESVGWIVADVTAWRPDRVYALWHDRAVLHFLTDEPARAAYAAALVAATGPGSVAILTTFAPGGPDRCSGLPVRRHGAADFARLLGPTFETVETFGSVHRTPRGADQRFWTHVARRTS